MPIEDFFKITVQKWGTGENDCLSRVAQTSLNNAGKTEEAGSWSKIEAQQTKIQNYNNEKEGHEIQKVDVVEDGQEILIPIDDAIAGLKADFDQKSAEYTEFLKGESEITGELTASNEKVSSALKNLDSANKAYNSIISNSQAPDEIRKHEENKLKEAKAAYAEAVQDQKEKADKLKEYKEKMAETQKAINELKSEIQKYTDKKEKTEEGIDKDLEELNKTLLMDEEDIKTAQNELDKLQKQMQEQQAEWKKQQDATDAAQKDATNGMSTAKELGFANENGEVISKDEASNANLDAERLSHGSVKDVQMGREKVVTYEDGTKYTYYRGKDSKLSDKPTITKTDGTTATGQAAAQTTQQQKSTEIDFNDIQTNELYKGEYVQSQVDKYTALKTKVDAKTATDAQKSELEQIYSDLQTYKSTVDELTKASDVENADDKVLAQQIADANVLGTYKDALNFKNVSVSDAEYAKDAKMEILKAQTEMIKQYDKTLESFNQDLTPTQELLANCDKNDFVNYMGRYRQSPYEINGLGNIESMTFDTMDRAIIDSYKKDALDNINYQTTQINDVYKSIDVKTMTETPARKEYDSKDVTKLVKKYNEFMDKVNSKYSWYSPAPGIVSEAREQAEKFLKAVLKGDGNVDLEINTVLGNLEIQYNKYLKD